MNEMRRTVIDVSASLSVFATIGVVEMPFVVTSASQSPELTLAAACPNLKARILLSW